VAIARAALDHARRHYADVLLVDTAALAIDEHDGEIARCTPSSSRWRRCSSSTRCGQTPSMSPGVQDALPLTGVVLTKLDAIHARRALSVRR